MKGVVFYGHLQGSLRADLVGHSSRASWQQHGAEILEGSKVCYHILIHFPGAISGYFSEQNVAQVAP